MTYQAEEAAALKAEGEAYMREINVDVMDYARLAVKYGKVMVPFQIVDYVEAQITTLGFIATHVTKGIGTVVFADAKPEGPKCRHCATTLSRDCSSATPLMCANCWEVVTRIRGMCPERIVALLREAGFGLFYDSNEILERLDGR